MLFSLSFSVSLLESYLWNGIQPAAFQCAYCEGGWPLRYSGTLMCTLRAGRGRWDLWKFSNPQGLDQQTWVRSFPLRVIIFLEEFTLWKSFASSCTYFFNLETILSLSIHLTHQSICPFTKACFIQPLAYLSQERKHLWAKLPCVGPLVMLNPSIFFKRWLKAETKHKI